MHPQGIKLIILNLRRVLQKASGDLIMEKIQWGSIRLSQFLEYFQIKALRDSLPVFKLPVFN